MAGPASASGQVLISEIMYNPDGNDSELAAAVEWVELFNNSPLTIDLSGWTLEDIQDNDSADPLPSGVSLSPGETLVLTGDAAAFDAQWGAAASSINRLQVGNFPRLSDSPSVLNEIVAIRNSQGGLVDHVNYDDQGAWPTDSPDGSSISLRPEALSVSGNDVGTAWIPSMGGVYGAWYSRSEDRLQNRGSPGHVATVPQQAFAASPDAAWSMVVLPDTQAYVKSSTNTAILSQMTQWIVDNRDALGVEFVLHEGDIVNQNSQVTPTSGDQSGDQQWQNAKAAMSLLDGVVPYAMSPGNHDYGTTNAQDRTTQFNDYFKLDDNPLIDPAHDGTLAAVHTLGQLDSAIHSFVAPDGREMTILATEWGPRDQTVSWAHQLMQSPDFADTTAVLLTHAYMHHAEARLDWSLNQDSDPTNNQGGNPHSYPTADDTNDGEDLWQKLVSKHSAFEMVMSGHIGDDGTGYLTSTADTGQPVHQMLFNTQFEPNGGNGWLRVLEFLDDGRTVRVRTYSPLYDLQKTDPANHFEFLISPLRPGDYNADGQVDAADYTLWRDSLNQSVTPWSGADGDGDGLVTAADYHVWRDGFSAAAPPAGLSVPAPMAGLLGLTAALAAGGRASRSTPARRRAST